MDNQRADDPESDVNSEHSSYHTDPEQSGNEENLEEHVPVVAQVPQNNLQGISVYYGKDNAFQWSRRLVRWAAQDVETWLNIYLV